MVGTIFLRVARLALLGNDSASRLPSRCWSRHTRAARFGLRWLSIGLLVWCAIDPIFAAKPSFRTDPTYLIDTWETEDGLPENSATAMAPTPDGYLWFGTFNGLVRFDGMKFTVFNPANTPQLPSASIINLHCDRGGRLWVSTSRGLAVREDWQWRTLGTNEGWAGNYVRTFAERANGDLLMTTFDGHMLEFVRGRLTELPPPPGESGKGYIGCVDEAGHWFVAQHQFIGSWDGQHWRQTVVSTTAGPDRVGCSTARDGGVWLLMGRELRKYGHGVEVSRVPCSALLGGFWSMSEDSRGNVWICTYDRGVFQILPDGRTREWTMTNGLNSASARFVFEDREGNLWVGTSGGGLARFKQRRFQSIGVENGLAERVVNSLWPDPDGGLWIATQSKGLFRLHDGGVTNVPLPVPDLTIYARSVLTDRQGRLWLGTSRDLWLSGKENSRRTPFGQQRSGDIRALFEDSRGRVWIGGGSSASMIDGESLRVFTAADGLPADPARCFAEDGQGVLWLSTHNGVFGWEKDRFVELQDNGRPLRDITCLKPDADGTLWMGTLDDGLLCRRDGRLAKVGAEAGLPIRAVHGILEDAAGFFWLTSNRGVVRVPAKDLRLAAEGKVSRLDCHVMDLSDGLPSVECASGNQPTCARDANGRLWFATLKGVAMIDPAEFRLNSNPPPVAMEQVVYHVPATKAVRQHSDDSTAHPFNASTPQRELAVRLTAPFAQPLSLPAGSHQIEIHYTALSFCAPERVRFQVKLDGHDADWQDLGNLRVASFHTLSPDEYVFRVRAANNDGVWNETGASLAFTVLPFYWQTIWFRVLLAIGLAGSGAGTVWAVVRGKLRQHKEKLAHQRALAQSEQRMNLAASAAELGVWEWDMVRDEIWTTDKGRTLLGFAQFERIDSSSFLEAVHSDDREPVSHAVAKSMNGDGEYQAEYRVALPNHPLRWIAARGRVEFNDARKPVVMRGVSLDITARKQAEEALRESEARFRTVANTAPVLIWMSGPDKLCNFFNKGWLDFTGRTLEQELGNGWAEGVHRQDLDRCLDVYTNSFNARQEFSMEYRLRTRGGEYGWVLDTGVPRFAPDGAFLGYIGSCVDITGRKQSELEIAQQRNELAHLSRVTMLGELSGSLAHELNQPLTAILSNAQAALRFLAHDNADLNEVRDILADIVAEDKRAGEVIRRLRLLLKKGETERQLFDLNEVVREVLKLVRSDLVNQGVTVDTELAPALPAVNADRVQLQQVLLNLVMNACDAMAGGPAGDHKLIIRTGLDAGEGISVSVADRGVGLAPDKLEQVFGPFFTTKVHGMGLGLSVCRTIITAHGGKLWAANNPEGGATFYFTLPAVGEGE